ncbi:Acetolactate synthase, mitochondrial, partial [Coemansia aciculifera]
MASIASGLGRRQAVAVSSALKTISSAHQYQQRRLKTTTPMQESAAAATPGTQAAAAASSSKPQRWSPAQPLAQRGEKEYDDSFVGMTGGEIFHEMMLRHGVEKVFGYPGGAILPVFDAIHNSSYFDFILPRHEQGGGQLAEAYARVTGKPGVVLVTSGPGATNIITPLQDALSDGVPLIDVTGGVLSRAIPNARPFLPSRPMPESIGRSGAHDSARVHSATLQRVAELCNGAARPVIYAGHGVLTSPQGWRMLREFAERANIPVTTTLMGLGAFDELDPKALHMLGMHGSVAPTWCWRWARDDRVTGNLRHFAPAAKQAALEGRGGIVHFDILPKNINKTVNADVAVEGD